jgi:hypothetical protein
MQTNAEARVAAAWVEASTRLGVRVVAPFRLPNLREDQNGLVYLPDFGGPNGIVLFPTEAPDFKTDEVLVAEAERCGYAWSFVCIQTMCDRLASWHAGCCDA